MAVCCVLIIAGLGYSKLVCSSGWPREQLSRMLQQILLGELSVIVLYFIFRNLILLLCPVNSICIAPRKPVYSRGLYQLLAIYGHASCQVPFFMAIFLHIHLNVGCKVGNKTLLCFCVFVTNKITEVRHKYYIGTRRMWWRSLCLSCSRIL